MVTNQEFLSTIFDLDEGEAIAALAFTEDPDKREFWTAREPDDPNHRALVIGEKRETANTYYCISAVKRAVPLSRSRKAATRLFVVPLDDVGYAPGSKVSPENVPLEPSYKIETSCENWQYGYILAEPMEKIGRAGALVSAVGKMADRGGVNAVRWMRLPNGLNTKAKHKKWLVTCTDWHPERRFTEAELVAAFNIPPATLDAAESIIEATGDGAADDDLFNWLLHTGQVLNPEPNDQGWCVIRCPWAHEHTDPEQNEAGYSPVGVGGPEYGQYRQFKCMHSHCADKTWVNVAHRMFVDRFVLNRGQTTLDMMLPGAPPMKVDAFRTWARNYSYTISEPNKPPKTHFIAEQWLSAKVRKSVDTENFNPAHPRIYVDPLNRLRTFNTFADLPTFPPTMRRDKVAPFVEHMKFLFGPEFTNGMAFLAWTVHRPEVRVQFALLHIAIHHGIGRGFLKHLTKHLLGSEYIRNPSLKDFMIGQFNEWLYRSLLLTFDEVRQKSVKFAVQDQLRELITERRMAINRKNLPRFEADIFANIIFLSNHLDALQIPDQDRRLWVVVNYEEPKDEAYYDRLYGLLDDPEALAQIHALLAEYLVVRTFNPNGRAPVTKFTHQARNASKSELELELTEICARLRSVGARVIYKRHFFELCRHFDVSLPQDILSRHGGGSSKEKAQFWAIMSELNVLRTTRVTPSQEASRIVGSIEGKQEMLVLDLHLANASLESLRELAEELAVNKFLNLQIETHYRQRARNLM